MASIKETWIGKPVEKISNIAKGAVKVTGNMVDKVVGDSVMRDACNKFGRVKGK